MDRGTKSHQCLDSSDVRGRKEVRRVDRGGTSWGQDTQGGGRRVNGMRSEEGKGSGGEMTPGVHRT